MATYSLAQTGVAADNLVTKLAVIDVPDTDLSGNVCSSSAAGMGQTMRNGALIQCKGPDGGLHWYKFDNERSTFSKPVLLYVGP